MSSVLTLGESLMRLSTVNNARLRRVNQLNVVFGGAEANVAQNLAQLDHKVKYATKVPNNELSENILFQMRGVGVDTTQILKDDSNGRLGSYFLEVGSDLRASSVIYDRANSAIAAMSQSEWDLEKLFEGVTHFHTTGITLALSKFWNEYLIELIKYAKSKGIKVIFDMNYRAGLWTQQEAKVVFSKVLPYVDVLSANRLDAKFFMDIDVDNQTDSQQFLQEIGLKYPNLQAIFGTNRESITPNAYNLTGFYYEVPKQNYYESNKYEIRYVVDRVGAGDAYAAGIIDGIVNQKDGQQLVEFAIGASVLKHSVFGDANQFNRQQIEHFINTKGGNIVR